MHQYRTIRTTIGLLSVTALLGGCMANGDIAASQAALSCEDPAIAEEQVMVAIDTEWIEMTGHERPDDTDDETEATASQLASSWCDGGTGGPGGGVDVARCIQLSARYSVYYGRQNVASSWEEFDRICEQLRNAHAHYFLGGCNTIAPLPPFPEECQAIHIRLEDEDDEDDDVIGGGL